MKKFRQIWLVFVAVVVLLFGAYYGMQMIKADSSGRVISGGGDLLEISIHDDD